MIKSRRSLHHSFTKSIVAKCQHIKSMITTTLSRKKKQATNQYYGDQTAAIPTVEINNDRQDNTITLNHYPTVVRSSYEQEDDDDRNSLSSTLFLPDEDDCYSSSSSVVSEEHALQQEEQRYSHLNVYSNLYEKLPNGNWLVSYRTRDEKILSSHEIKSYMI